MGATSEEIVFCGRTERLFQPERHWVVMAHNLDDAGDVEQVGGPFPTQTEAEAEAERLERSPH